MDIRLPHPYLSNTAEVRTQFRQKDFGNGP
jgi:hypothetical protein